MRAKFLNQSSSLASLNEAQPEMEESVSLAMILLGAPFFPIRWGGRIRLLSAAPTARSRYTSVKWTPATRWNARLFREFSAIRSALHAPERMAQTGGVSDWPPKSVRHLRPLDAIVGTPSPTQSVLVRFVEPKNGRPRAVAKVMVSRDSHAAERIAAESKATRDPVLDGVVPRHWETGVIDGHHYLITEFVAGPSLSPSQRGMMTALDTLAFQSSGTEVVSIHEHPWVQRVLKRIPWLRRERLIGQFPIARTHGDFAPWNILVRPDWKLTLIDWEFSEPDGVAGVDLAHYLLVTKQLLGRQDPRTAVQSTSAELRDLEGCTSDEARTVMALAAASVLIREPNENNKASHHFWREVIKYCALRLNNT